MTYDPDRHHRRSTRLQGWNYAAPGAYFVTICAAKRAHLFGEVAGGEVAYSSIGDLVRTLWLQIPSHHPHAQLDEWVIMPNHMHGLVIITAPNGDDADGRGEASAAPPAVRPLSVADASPLRPNGTTPGSVGAIIQNFKSVTTRRANRLRRTPGAPVWQRGFHDHIARDERELNAIRRYIHNNPRQWTLDRDNRANTRRLPPPGSAADYLADLSIEAP